MILAFDGETPLGFIHVGFGPNDQQTALDHSTAVICAIAVRPGFRKKGVGTELLNKAEAFARDAGAKVIIGGAARPLNPFYFGVYGGSDAPGFLKSDPTIGSFLEKHGYVERDRYSVLQRRLEVPITVADARFPQLRKRFDVTIQPRTGLGSWWQESVLGPVDPVELRVEDRATRQTAGRALVWEMEGYSYRWNSPAAGILDLNVREDLRRTGLGRFFLAHLLRYLQEQYFGICECQAHSGNAGALRLLQSMGFAPVDVGVTYIKNVSGF
ncbi:MAG: GNAT family N-acetyltransferase [Gemmataceae bacterium]|nr:GNAT family N-acetyltransferase [Gemmataceae bacterium]